MGWPRYKKVNSKSRGMGSSFIYLRKVSTGGNFFLCSTADRLG